MDTRPSLLTVMVNIEILADLTIIAIIVTRRKTLLRLNAIFSIALYVIYKLERNR